MRFLLCCEFYHPSVGGVQVVMRQIAERLAVNHEVVVATTKLADRNFKQLENVTIEEFAVTGNLVNGIQGEVERYREFVRNFKGDGLLIKAAQQWTFDALWPILDDVKMRKVFIPCGFSGLYWEPYKQYFNDLPDILRKWDQLIFYANDYRDVNFARQNGLSHYSIVPNGASELEFEGADQDPYLRQRLGISDDSFVFLTVGSRTGVKGHREIVEAFSKMDAKGRAVTLVLNGNTPPVPKIDGAKKEDAVNPDVLSFRRKLKKRRRALKAAVKSLYRKIRYGSAAADIVAVGSQHSVVKPIEYWAVEANKQSGKRVLEIDLPRTELVSMFRQADLFVFASNIEYSPLVLYETAAAGTPFLTVPVGNSAEIAQWTGAGLICPANMDVQGFTRVDPNVLAEAMTDAMLSPKRLNQMGQTGRQRWRQYFTWQKISTYYEAALRGEKVLSQDFMQGTE